MRAHVSIHSSALQKNKAEKGNAGVDVGGNFK